MHIFHVFVSSLLLYILNTTKGNYPTNGLEESVVLALFRGVLTTAVKTFIILP